MSEELMTTLMQAGRLAERLLKQIPELEQQQADSPNDGLAQQIANNTAMLEQQLTLLEQHHVLSAERTRALLAPQVLAELTNRATMRALPDSTAMMQLATQVLEGNTAAISQQASVILNISHRLSNDRQTTVAAKTQIAQQATYDLAELCSTLLAGLPAHATDDASMRRAQLLQYNLRMLNVTIGWCADKDAAFAAVPEPVRELLRVQHRLGHMHATYPGLLAEVAAEGAPDLAAYTAQNPDEFRTM